MLGNFGLMITVGVRLLGADGIPPDARVGGVLASALLVAAGFLAFTVWRLRAGLATTP